MLAPLQYQHMKDPGSPGRALLLFIAVLGWLGLILQLIVSARAATNAGRSPLAGIVDALCYFTVLTNVLVAIVTTAGVTRRRGFFVSRGVLAATAVYIFVVGLIYSLLLRSLWAPTGLHQLSDALLHDIVPLVYVIWWLCCAPKGGLRWGQTIRWLGYPLAYFAFSVLLGAFTGRYLYPFADISALGLATVLRNGVFLLALFEGLALGAVGLDRVLSGAQRAPHVP
jgi:hypothetical protein